MWKITPLLILISLLGSCGAENDPHQKKDSARRADSAAAVTVPTFDISAPFTIKYKGEILTPANGDEGPFVSVLNAKPTDTLYIQYGAVDFCEECHLETQIWADSKYKDVVRDTGYGTGGWTEIPLGMLNYHPEETEAQNISFYLSVRQFHPVETGNKRFLFNLKLQFAGKEQ